MNGSRMEINQMLLENRESIIRHYRGGMSVHEVAEMFGVADSTIYIKLNCWGVKLQKRRYTYVRFKERKRSKRDFSPELSPELLAKRAEATRINDQHAKFFKVESSRRDRLLVYEVCFGPSEEDMRAWTKIERCVGGTNIRVIKRG